MRITSPFPTDLRGTVCRHTQILLDPKRPPTVDIIKVSIPFDISKNQLDLTRGLSRLFGGPAPGEYSPRSLLRLHTRLCAHGAYYSRWLCKEAAKIGIKRYQHVCRVSNDTT